MSSSENKSSTSSSLMVSVASFVLIGLVCVMSVFYISHEKQVTIMLDGEAKQVLTLKSTVGDVLNSQGITVSENDSVEPELDCPVERDEVINIVKAMEVMVRVDGEEHTVYTLPTSVKNVLAKLNISLDEYDEVSLPLDQVITAGASIDVARVEVKYETVEGVIPIPVEKTTDDTLEKGINKVIAKGKEGKSVSTVVVKYKDGAEVYREVLESQIIEQPVPKVVANGTITVASRGGNSFHFSQALSVEATAYTHTGNRTRTGTNPKVGTVAVDPGVIPLGSKLYVEGYGYAVAEDTGGAIKGNIVDVFLDTENACIQWGRKHVKVYVLE